MKIRNKMGNKKRLFEMMQSVNKIKLNENWDQELNNTLMMAIEKLKSGALNVDQGGTNRTAMQSVDDVSYVGINGYDSEKNMYNFNFKITGNEGDQDGVFNVDDVILEKFFYQNPQGEKIYDVDENQLVDFNKRFGSELYDIIEKYVGEDLQPAGEFDEINEDLKFDTMKKIDKKEDSQPFGGSKKEFQDGMGYGDEKPVNPKLRVKAPELEKFVEGDDFFDKIEKTFDLVPITTQRDKNGFRLYRDENDMNVVFAEKDGDLYKTDELGEPTYALKGDITINGLVDDNETNQKGLEHEKQGLEDIAAQYLGEEENGENLIKKNYNALNRDLDFNKLSQAYENMLKIKHGEFRDTDVMQTALSSLRNTIAAYLKGIKNINVNDMDVQNYFENMINKFSSVMSEEEDVEKESPEGWKDVDGTFQDDGGIMKWTEKSEEAPEEEEISPEEPVEEPAEEVPSLDPEDVDGDGDMIKGGLADDADVGQYDPEQVLMGMEVEMEHTDDPRVALEISMDHLEEIPDYYTHLDKMEKDVEGDSELPGIGTDDEGMSIPAIEPPMDIEGIEGKPETPETDDERNLLKGWEDEKSKDRELEDELLGFEIETPNVPKQDGSGMGIGANKGRGCEVEDENVNEENNVGDRYKDTEGNEFVIKDFVSNGVTLKGQAGEKEIALSDLEFYEKLNEYDFAAQEREHEDSSAYNRFQELDAKGFDNMNDEEQEEFYKLWVEFGKDKKNEY